MTGALVIYSGTFMRYALAVSPKNYLLFACHAVNFSAQLTQGYRYLNYWKYVTEWLFLPTHIENYKGNADFCINSWGGREAQLAEAAKQGKDATEAGA